MIARIYNSRIDVEIEGDSQEEILAEFARDYPSAAEHSIIIEWDGGRPSRTLGCRDE